LGGWSAFRREGSRLARRLLFVAFFIEVGLLLIILPWSSYWERNYFMAVWPAVEPLLVSSYARGAVTGIGIVNLYAGFAELVPMFGSRARKAAAGSEVEP
jgi:hypothetical protein